MNQELLGIRMRLLKRHKRHLTRGGANNCYLRVTRVNSARKEVSEISLTCWMPPGCQVSDEGNIMMFCVMYFKNERRKHSTNLNRQMN